MAIANLNKNSKVILNHENKRLLMMMEKLMYPVKIVWIPPEKGGRKSIPPEGKYYSVSRFPDDTDPQDNAWSVVFQLKNQENKAGKIISFGLVDFLVDWAPREKFEKHDQFEIYEGFKKVADVIIL